jgi:uncharacterized protein YqjF (DUF2071 family)
MKARLPGMTALHQRWSGLFFAHWEVAASDVAATLPPGLTPDLHEGRAHVGLVGFRMEAIRPPGLPAVPWLSWFTELNVRLYVKDRAGVPGVWFLSLDCDRRPAVHLARATFGLPYVNARMSWRRDGDARALTCRRTGEPTTARYRWHPTGPAAEAPAGSLDHHLCERYAFYSVRGGRLLRGRVAHAPYRISPAALVSEAGSAPLGWDGLRGFPTDAPPDLVHCCDGVEVRAGFPEWVRA